MFAKVDGQWGTDRWARKEALLYTRVLHTSRSRVINLAMKPGYADSINDLHVAGVLLKTHRLVYRKQLSLNIINVT